MAEEAPGAAGASRAEADAVPADDLDQVVAGIDVKIEKVTSTVSTDGDGTLSTGLLGQIVNTVLDGLRRPRRPPD